MDLKDIQKKLAELRDRIKDEGRISYGEEEELKSLLNQTLATASNELNSIQTKLTATLSLRADNDNTLTEDQKKRLKLIETTGTGSQAVH